jgi:hypothetical protein
LRYALFAEFAAAVEAASCLGASNMYDENRVAAISAKVAASVDAATFGVDTWDNLPSLLSSEFPGSFGALWNINFSESRLNFLSFQNLDPAFAKSFCDYYAYINPWSAYWISVKSGMATSSEEVFPARSFADTEFYNDWLLPQKDEAISLCFRQSLA